MVGTVHGRWRWPKTERWRWPIPALGECFVNGRPENSKQTIGIWTCIALVMGNMIGSGIFLLPAALASYGSISLVGWLFTSGGALVLALMFSRLSRAIPANGGPYAYSRAGLGDFAAFWVAWGYWISLLCGNAAIAVALDPRQR